MLDVTINGDARGVEEGTTIEALLASLELPDSPGGSAGSGAGGSGPGVAVEVNRVIVPRRKHAETVLANGDEIEIVTFVGGG